MKKKVFLLLILTLVSCNEIEQRKPLNKKLDSFMISSAQRNKNLFKKEAQLLKEAAKKDSLYNYKISESGFLYRYIEISSQTISFPSKGEVVRFQYQIEDLNKNIIYSFEELGPVEYAIDQEDLLPALREGLRLLRPDDIAVFLFPSYLCYSYQGDNQKIGINQPLRFIIKRLPLTNK
ncbi:MAG: gliding motility-associated peptidyl-prolyl isomerase GldI [Flavobacteriaceae bacterium]|nr:gliding motility-associated peptidyl-prolyl isomerase GldI [Flavobacteriaceae bacterium]